MFLTSFLCKNNFLKRTQVDRILEILMNSDSNEEFTGFDPSEVRNVNRMAPGNAGDAQIY